MTFKNGYAYYLFILRRMQLPEIISLTVSTAHLFVPLSFFFLMQVH